MRANPGIPADIRRGEFTAPELIERVTGGPLRIEPYLDYLWGKYRPLYGLRDEERQAAGVA